MKEISMRTTMTDDELAKALIDPANVFSDPMAVVNEDSLPDERKREILKRWEYDAREMQVAEEEGFPAREPGCLLDAILAALHQLGAGPDIEHSPQTKQGSV
jgi:hypothetical protein